MLNVTRIEDEIKVRTDLFLAYNIIIISFVALQKFPTYLAYGHIHIFLGGGGEAIYIYEVYPSHVPSPRVWISILFDKLPRRTQPTPGPHFEAKPPKAVCWWDTKRVNQLLATDRITPLTSEPHRPFFLSSAYFSCTTATMDPLEPTDSDLQKLEEKAAKAQEAFEKEEKLRKEVEALNAKLLQEKTDLLASLEGEKGSLAEYQEKSNKLQAQKADLESQLHVSILTYVFVSYLLSN